MTELYSSLHNWCGPKVGTTEGKHGTLVRSKKDILTKVTKDSVTVSGAYYPVVSDIGSRTTCTPANDVIYEALCFDVAQADWMGHPTPDNNTVSGYSSK